MNMFSKVIRRTHMYLALFLAPWMLMYALSTIVMNHRALFQRGYGGRPPAWEKEREQSYSGTFPAGASGRMIAEQMLNDLRMEGAHNVSGPAAGGRITIVRQDPIAPRRITYSAADQKVVIEKQVFRTPAFLERMHRRRGYQHPYVLEDTWAFSVDLVIFALVFWVASGLWMWWEMRPTRVWGAAFSAIGAGLFGLFLFTI